MSSSDILLEVLQEIKKLSKLVDELEKKVETQKATSISAPLSIDNRSKALSLLAQLQELEKEKEISLEKKIKECADTVIAYGKKVPYLNR